jgi:hypothetical protein
MPRLEPVPVDVDSAPVLTAELPRGAVHGQDAMPPR